ncbi:hypothetical protein NVP1052A_56 [Vibrio phage 1.052.A._10N.286.46.C3]|nr:hypothetical protein NVP1052A_56 [Vibrio phage 1.052.A._10N.286.46.C3]
MESNINLYSIGTSDSEAKKVWNDDPIFVLRMAEINQKTIEKALGTRDVHGNAINDSDQMRQFKIVMGVGYFPIIGDLVVPAGSGTLSGQGSFVRRKAVGGELTSVIKHTTALCPIGSMPDDFDPSNTNGLLTQCGSSKIQDFSISGCLKNKGDGGSGLIIGHTPPLSSPTSAPATSQEYWARRSNTQITQKRFVEPQVFSSNVDRGNEAGRASHRNDLSHTSNEITGNMVVRVPDAVSFCCSTDVFRDDTVDIPLVRWVRAFDADGVELLRYCNAGEGIVKGKRIPSSIDDAGRLTTSRPTEDDINGVKVGNRNPRAYHEASDSDILIFIPEGVPEGVESIEVSFYNLQEFETLRTEMTPYLSGKYYAAARASLNDYSSIVVDGMPWNGFVGVDGAYNTHRDLVARNCGLDAWYFPGGYEDYMHNTFGSCAGVNCGGWGVYLSEPTQCSQNAKDRGKWPNSDGFLEVHTKYTYTAATNDLGNFDTYGNRGGAYYFGAAANSIQAGALEHHFDSHNLDPFLSARLDLADWNPARWAACVVFAANATANRVRMISTPTDARRVLFCRTRIKEQSPAETNLNSNVYSALSANHYSHPRPDSYGSLIEVRPPSVAQLHIAPYSEHEGAGGHVDSVGGGVAELQGLFSGFNEVTFRPWLYDRTPAENHATSAWRVGFTAKNKNRPGAAKEVALTGDLIGIENEGLINHLHYLSFTRLFSGSERATVIEPGRAIVVSKIVSFFDGITSLEEYTNDSVFNSFDFKHLHVMATYVQDEISDPEAPTLPDDVVMMPARVRLYEHDSPKADGTPRRVRVMLPLFNMGDEPINLSGQTHTFNFRFEIGREH